ncbi:MAG: hypothetical protein J6A90_06865 [Clostridia bacterium]|nr:hypothetical protein [Clostridia bacterium]
MFNRKPSMLKLAQEKNEQTIARVNSKIGDIGKVAFELYSVLDSLQTIFDKIRNVPTEKKEQYLFIKSQSSKWKQQVDNIDVDYKNSIVKNAGAGAVGVGVGVAVVTMGPTAAMGIATTFGAASTGTAISTLSGAAATNAALAWLGGGALAAGGGGMAAGNAFLALAGPVGWAIAGVSLLGAGFFLWKSTRDKKRLEDIYTLIAKRDTKFYEMAIVEINERILRIKNSVKELNEAVNNVKTFGLDYSLMTYEQQCMLGIYLNCMASSIQLLVMPIKGLQPKYDEHDFNKFMLNKEYSLTYKNVIIYLANLLYAIKLEENDKVILWKSIAKNKEMLKSFKIKKENFTYFLVDQACKALKFQALGYSF